MTRFFAMGFCQAQDRGFQMELYLRVARGTIADAIAKAMEMLRERAGADDTRWA